MWLQSSPAWALFCRAVVTLSNNVFRATVITAYYLESTVTTGTAQCYQRMYRILESFYPSSISFSLIITMLYLYINYSALPYNLDFAKINYNPGPDFLMCDINFRPCRQS